ncbi:transposase [Mycobacterium aquaticum]|uniref:Transposase n=2 Tax=Mycobacterium aquaticum TaxID=1927124 RepID=A0A1X0AHW3_9MYCO|nr:transposase [Mycobacterium aquaticum]
MSSHWIFTPDSEVDQVSMKVLCRYRASSQQTYAYSLVDHLNWAYFNRLSPQTLTLADLQRYMHSITGEAATVHGVAWRDPNRRPLSAAAASNVATIIKAYYLSPGMCGQVNPELVAGLTAGAVERRRGGRARGNVEVNPLSPRRTPRRPRYLPDEAVEALFEPGILTTARDVMIVTWLHDGGLRVGGLCGLRFSDLHLIEHHPCGQRADPHIHIIGRDDNPNGARAKSYGPAIDNYSSREGYTIDGVIRAVSAGMISTFYGYLLDEYYPAQHLVEHEQVLNHTRGATPGAALTTAAVRKMLDRASRRAGLSTRITPHAFRHKAAAAFYAATDFNAEMVAQEFGWANPEIVTDLYGRSANRHAMAFLKQAWDATARPRTDSYLNTTEHTGQGQR